MTYPNGNAIPIGPVRGHARHAGKADFGTACATCPDPAWQTDCRATRPKVEHKLAHLMRRRHGGRRARMRGRLRIAADFTLLAAAVNLARLATHGLNHTTHRLLQSQLLDCGLARGSLLMQNERLLRTRLAVPQKSILNVLGTLA